MDMTGLITWLLIFGFFGLFALIAEPRIRSLLKVSWWLKMSPAERIRTVLLAYIAGVLTLIAYSLHDVPRDVHSIGYNTGRVDDIYYDVESIRRRMP